MKKYQWLGLVLIVVLVFSAVVISAAGATEFLSAEWLAAGLKIAAAEASDGEGELELVALNGGGLKLEVKVLCSGVLVGTVGPGSGGTVTGLLSLAGTAISTTVLSGTGLSCTDEENCESPKVWATGLPWKTEVVLMLQGTESFLTNLVKSSAGFYVECTILGAKIAEECTTSEAAIETVDAVGGLVEQKFSDAFQALAGLKLANCSLGGSETGEVDGTGQLLLTSGTALTASSE